MINGYINNSIKKLYITSQLLKLKLNIYVI